MGGIDKFGKLIILGYNRRIVERYANDQESYDLNNNGKIDPDERELMLDLNAGSLKTKTLSVTISYA